MKNLKELIPLQSKSKKIVKESIEDLDVNLPTNVEKFLDKLAVQIKQYNLPRKKETLVIARIIDAMGMDKNDVMRAISKIKQAGVIGQKKNDVVEAAKAKETLREAELDIKPGFQFTETYSGYTVSGRDIVSIGWEVVKDLGNDTFLCKQIHNDTVMKVNPDYKVKFTRKQIEAIKRR